VYKLIVASAIILFAFIVWIIYMANISADSLFFDLVKATPYGDKVGHVLLYGFLTLAANLTFRIRTFVVYGWRFYIGTVIVSLLVFLEELSQAFLPSRTFDLVDLAADMIGITVFTILSVKVVKSLSIKPQDRI